MERQWQLLGLIDPGWKKGVVYLQQNQFTHEFLPFTFGGYCTVLYPVTRSTRVHQSGFEIVARDFFITLGLQGKCLQNHLRVHVQQCCCCCSNFLIPMFRQTQMHKLSCPKSWFHFWVAAYLWCCPHATCWYLWSLKVKVSDVAILEIGWHHPCPYPYLLVYLYLYLYLISISIYLYIYISIYLYLYLFLSTLLLCFSIHPSIQSIIYLSVCL